MATCTYAPNTAVFSMQDDATAHCSLNNVDVEVMDCSEAFLSLESDATGAVPSPYLMLDALGAASASHIATSPCMFDGDESGPVPSPYLMLDALHAATHFHRQDSSKHLRHADKLPQISTLDRGQSFQNGNQQPDLHEAIKTKDETIEQLRERVKLLETIQTRDDAIAQLNSRLALLEGGLRGPLARSCDGAESEVSTSATGPKEVSIGSISGQSIGSPATSTREIATETDCALNMPKPALHVQPHPNQQQFFPPRRQPLRPVSGGPAQERNSRPGSCGVGPKHPVPVEVVPVQVVPRKSQKILTGRPHSLDRQPASQQQRKPQVRPSSSGRCTPTFSGYCTPTPAVCNRTPTSGMPISRSCTSMSSSPSTQSVAPFATRSPQSVTALARARSLERPHNRRALSPPQLNRGASLSVAAGCMPVCRQGSIKVTPGKVSNVTSASGSMRVPGVVLFTQTTQTTIRHPSRHPSPSPNKNLDGSCTTGIGSSLSSLASQSMPSTARSTSSSVTPSFSEFYRVHNHLALPLMKQTANLGKAYRYLSEANELHIKISGLASGEALYNMACCLALAADAQLQPAVDPAAMFRDVSPGLPPANSSSLSGPALVESRVDLAVDVLDRAIKAGYRHVAHMCSDPDFRAVRELRPARFSVAVAAAQGKPILF